MDGEHYLCQSPPFLPSPHGLAHLGTLLVPTPSVDSYHLCVITSSPKADCKAFLALASLPWSHSL